MRVEERVLRAGENRDAVEADAKAGTRTHMTKSLYLHFLIVVSAGKLKIFVGYADRRPAVVGSPRKVYRARKKPLHLAHTCRTSRLCQHSIRAVSVVLLSTSSSREHVVIAYVIDVMVTNSSSKHTV